MDSKQLIQDLLELQNTGWIVTDLEKNEVTKTLYVTLAYRTREEIKCPLCGQKGKIHDHKLRQWRHMNLGFHETILQAKVPRIDCDKCNKVTQINVPWADKNMRMTEMFCNQLVLAATRMSIIDTARTYRVKWHSVSTAINHTVKKCRVKKKQNDVKRIGIDEIARKKGHKYLTLISDLDRKEIIWIGEDRRYETLKDFIQFFTVERFKGLETICCDMWDPYIKAIREYGKEDVVVFDKFHIKKHLNESVDKVRRQEHNYLKSQGIDLLTNTKYLWLKNPQNLTCKQALTFKELNRYNLKIFRAYEIKELFNHFWNYQYQKAALRFFKRWYFRATHSRLNPVIKTAKTIKKYFYGIINYVKHKVTNSFAEGINCKIRVFTRRAYGYRKIETLMNMIYLGCGGLELPTQ